MIVKCKVEILHTQNNGTIILPMEYETPNLNPIETFNIEGNIEEDVRYAFNIDEGYQVNVDVEKGQ